MLARISVVIISKNTASLLPEFLASVNWADEIILLDSGSSDNTVKIAHDAGVKVFTNSNWLGYGIQRQRAQHFATGDYILMIDADERVTPKLKESIQNVLSLPRKGIVYSIARRNYFLGRFMRYSGLYPDRVIRLYERACYQYNNNQVHESLSCKNAKIISIEGDLLHLACYDFSTFQKKQLEYAFAWAKERYQQGKKTSIIGIFARTIGSFLRTLVVRAGILDGKRGWILAAVNAQYTFNKYTELWALNNGY